MRITIKSKDKGVLVCSTSGIETVEFEFPTVTLYDWYPIDRNYHYLYNKKDDRLYITPIDTKTKYPRYGIDYRAGRVNETNVTFTPGEWENKEVKEDNRTIIAYAKDMGFSTPEDDYTLDDIDKDIATISDMWDEMSEEAEKRALEDGLDVLDYRRMDSESQDMRTYKYLSEEEVHKYYKLGLVYNLLIIMQKVLVGSTKELVTE